MSDDDHEVVELRNEVVRHHRDFAAISEVCERARRGEVAPTDALQTIRNIVG